MEKLFTQHYITKVDRGQLTVYAGNSAFCVKIRGSVTAMPLKKLLGTFAAVYYFFLALLPEVSAVNQRSLLLLRHFQTSRRVVAALLNTHEALLGGFSHPLSLKFRGSYPLSLKLPRLLSPKQLIFGICQLVAILKCARVTRMP